MSSDRPKNSSGISIPSESTATTVSGMEHSVSRNDLATNFTARNELQGGDFRDLRTDLELRSAAPALARVMRDEKVSSRADKADRERPVRGTQGSADGAAALTFDRWR